MTALNLNFTRVTSDHHLAIDTWMLIRLVIHSFIHSSRISRKEEEKSSLSRRSIVVPVFPRQWQTTLKSSGDSSRAPRARRRRRHSFLRFFSFLFFADRQAAGEYTTRLFTTVSCLYGIPIGSFALIFTNCLRSFLPARKSCQEMTLFGLF